MAGIIDFVNDPNEKVSKWFLDSPQTVYDAVLREYRDVHDRLFGDVRTLSVDELKMVIAEMFPDVLDDWRGNIWRSVRRVELEDKFNAWDKERLS